MTTKTKTETGSYNFPSSLPTEDGMETLRKIMDEVEAIFFNSPMNENQRVSFGGVSSGISFGAAYEEGSDDCFEIWRNYDFHRNYIGGFAIPDFKFQVSSKGNYSGWVPSYEYELKIFKVLKKYRLEAK